MNRDDLVEKVWRSITAHSLDDWAAAEDAVDAILPQVTTVEELKALPIGTRLTSGTGGVYRVTPTGSLALMGSASEPWDSVSALAITGPLTVVWQP